MGTTPVLGNLNTKIKDGLALVTFGHPASNSLNSSLLNRLCEEFNRLGAMSEVSVILLQSEGERAFCAGASFDELLTVATIEESTYFFGGFARLINAIRTCPKLVVGKIQGKAVGGGVGLIAACDYVLASANAAIRLSEISIGIAPLVIAPAVSRKISVAGLAALSLAPKEWKSAQWALQRGLYDRIFENQDELEMETLNYARELASFPTESLIALKETLWEGTNHWDTLLEQRAAITGKLALSDTTQKILRAFKEKNNPPKSN